MASGISDGRGVVTLLLRTSFAAGHTIALTAEPSGGRDQPTGKPILAGQS